MGRRIRTPITWSRVAPANGGDLGFGGFYWVFDSNRRVWSGERNVSGESVSFHQELTLPLRTCGLFRVEERLDEARGILTIPVELRSQAR